MHSVPRIWKLVHNAVAVEQAVWGRCEGHRANNKPNTNKARARPSPC